MHAFIASSVLHSLFTCQIAVFLLTIGRLFVITFFVCCNIRRSRAGISGNPEIGGLRGGMVVDNLFMGPRVFLGAKPTW